MRYLLTPAQLDDQQWLEQLRRAVYRELFFATWGEWDEAKHLRHCAECWERGKISVIEIDGVRVGMLQVANSSDAVEVSEIQIAPSHQNQGIGTALLTNLTADAQAEGKKLSLSVARKNHRALAWYRRLGFQQVGQTDTHLQLERPA